MLTGLLDAAILVAIAAAILATRDRFPAWQRVSLVSITGFPLLLVLLRHAQEAFGVEPYPWLLTCALVLATMLVAPVWADRFCDLVDALRNRTERTRATVAAEIDSILDEWMKES